jgi:hypothetical protein
MSLKSPIGRLAWCSLNYNPLIFASSIDQERLVADTLSRPPCSEENTETCSLCIIAIDLPSRGPADTRQGQLQDPKFREIIATIESGKPENASRWTGRGYLLSQGVLYRYSQEDDTEEAQLVVPQQEYANILKEYHDAPTTGHYGVDHTLRRVRKNYF